MSRPPDPSPPAAAQPLQEVERPRTASEPAEGPQLPLLLRLSDRLNPILVREVNQALNGKALVITASLALVAILLIALFVAARDHVSLSQGRTTFILAVQVMIPILMFIVPFHGFLSMRGEVGGGTVEHLLMSRLGPSAIVRGKLMASTVQFVLYLAIFSPLIGMTFLLRGVDVPTIAVFLLLSFVYALAASALGIACGALCRWPSIFRVLPFAIVLIGLLWFTILAMAGVSLGSQEMRGLITEPGFGRHLVQFMMPAVVLTILCSMVGSAVLAHPYENRSTKFRLFALAWLFVGAGFLLYENSAIAAALPPGGYSYFDLGEAMGAFAASSAAILFLFAIFAATEPRKLSPRVHARVPKRRWLALLVAPFLPGTGRGMVFVLLLSAVSLGLVWLVPLLAGAPPSPMLTGGEANWPLLTWLYVFLFSGVAGFIRSRLADTESRNWIARGSFPVLMLGSSVLPLLAAILSSERVSRGWSPLHVFNPFMTIERYQRTVDRSYILASLISLCAVVFILNLPSMIRGIGEVLRASKARRTHAQPPEQEPAA